MTLDEKTILEDILEKNETDAFLRLMARLLFFDIRSLLHIYKEDADVSFLGGKNLYVNMSAKIKDDSPLIIPAHIYVSTKEDDRILQKDVSVKLYDISRSDCTIAEDRCDIEKALKEREKALVLGGGLQKGYCRRTDMGLEFYLPSEVIHDKSRSDKNLLSMYIEEMLSTEVGQTGILIPFVKAVLSMHFFTDEIAELNILNIKLSGSGAEDAYEILSDVLKHSRILFEKLTYKRLSFNQTLMLNGLLLPDKERTISRLNDLYRTLPYPFIRWEASDLMDKLKSKGSGFFEEIYREKIIGGGIYTYPPKNMEDLKKV